MNGGDGWVNDKAVPLLNGAPPQVLELDHDGSHAVGIDEISEESKRLDVSHGSIATRSFAAQPGAECVRWVELLRNPSLTSDVSMGFAEFIIGPAYGRTRWLYPSYGLRAELVMAGPWSRPSKSWPQ